MKQRIKLGEKKFLRLVNSGVNSFDSVDLDIQNFPQLVGGNIYFSNCKFENNLELLELHVEKSLVFHRCTFQQVSFVQLEINNLIYFNECIFLPSASGQGLKFEASIVLNTINVHNCEINFIEVLKSKFLKGNLSIWESNKSNLGNTTIYISNSEFKSYTSINLESNNAEEGIIKLSGTTFLGDIHIRFNALNELQMASCLFAENLIVSNNIGVGKSNIKSFNVIGNIFEGFVNISSLAIFNLTILNNRSKTPFLFQNNQIKTSDSETFRYLKHEHLKKNDYTLAIEFRKRELYNGLISSMKPIKFFTFVNLGFNYLSNDFGTNWQRGILFTTITSTLLFSWYIFLMSPNLEIGPSLQGFKYIWINYGADFWKFFNPAHKPFTVNSLEPNFAGGFVDLLGRISVIYGSYQTAQAFRKFGRK